MGDSWNQNAWRKSPENENEEDDRKPAAKRHLSEHSDSDTKKIKQEPVLASSTHELTSSDVEILSEAPEHCPAAASLPHSDPEVQCVGATGMNALTDFPHAREHCLVHPFQVDANLFCVNCFCYVCDKPVSECQEWDNHCHATNANPKWRQERHQRANPSAAVGASFPSIYQNYRRQPTVKELLDAVTRIYPTEIAPQSPPFATELKHYQKQSLAFMMDVEHNYSIKSGWICSDVGMGKSAIVIAAICHNPMPVNGQPSAQQVKDARFTKERLNVKCTVIFTTKSLLGQWQDEVNKHAPHLKVYRVHSQSKIKLADLADADVIVTTSTVAWSSVFTKHYKYHRVVVDESHLFGTVSARLPHACGLFTDRKWNVTATPMTSSSSDLRKQVVFLGLEGERNAMSTEDFLKKYMIRHTKSQRINGDVALGLPESTTTVKMITMTSWERRTFKEAWMSKQYAFYGRSFGGMLTKVVDMRWYAPLIKPITCADSSKVELLKKDLQELLSQEPNMRAVVYSQFLEQHRFAHEAVKSLGLKTYCFNGSKTACQRDKYIREFQSLETAGPAVFLVTLKAGSVGITLTAASHVFLLEPCIDPAAEVQAAGRIHRLGQTKRVGVTKYVFEDSCESNILKLHDKIHNGEIEYTSGMLSANALAILSGS